MDSNPRNATGQVCLCVSSMEGNVRHSAFPGHYFYLLILGLGSSVHLGHFISGKVPSLELFRVSDKDSLFAMTVKSDAK